MLENNLHPDVAERPEDLVVYGGIGKAARNWASYRTIVRELTRLRDDETLLVQSGKPVAVFETHELAPRVLIANSNLVPQWATWEHFRELDAAGLDDVRADDGRLVDLHRQPGDPAGDLRDLRRRRAQALRRHARRAAGRDRRSRRHGRRAAARGDDARRHRAVRRGRPAAHRAPHRDRLPRRARRRPRRRAARASTRARARGPRAVDRPGRQRRRGRCPSSARAATSRSTSSPTRRARTTRSTATSPPG